MYIIEKCCMVACGFGLSLVYMLGLSAAKSNFDEAAAEYIIHVSVLLSLLLLLLCSWSKGQCICRMEQWKSDVVV